MTTKKKTAAGGRAKKLKLKKETIKDLKGIGSGKDVKGGQLKLTGDCGASQKCVTGGCLGTRLLCGPRTI